MFKKERQSASCNILTITAAMSGLGFVLSLTQSGGTMSMLESHLDVETVVKLEVGRKLSFLPCFMA